MEAKPKRRLPLVLRLLITIVLAVILLATALIAYLTAVEFRPDAEQPAETVAARGADLESAVPATPYTLLSFNTGYAGLGEESDFFMDGGKQTAPRDPAIVEKNLVGIRAILEAQKCDFLFLQEVDRNAKRSRRIDEAEMLASVGAYSAAFAPNYVCAYVPYPIPDTIGRVESGLLTLSAIRPAEQTRVALPVPFSWPLRIANLKRCLLVSRVPVADSEKELVLINLHLEAYDDGAGKIAQTKQLAELLETEYEKGNYVIAGGDFNQTFPGIDSVRYAMHDPENWTPGVIEADMLPSGWKILADDRTPTCRLLDRPFDREEPDSMQYYVIDGFLCSPNVTVLSLETLDAGFRYSDHNPVLLQFELQK